LATLLGLGSRRVVILRHLLGKGFARTGKRESGETGILYQKDVMKKALDEPVSCPQNAGASRNIFAALLLLLSPNHLLPHPSTAGRIG
jgi:hypothetical protein